MSITKIVVHFDTGDTQEFNSSTGTSTVSQILQSPSQSQSSYIQVVSPDDLNEKNMYYKFDGSTYTLIGKYKGFEAGDQYPNIGFLNNTTLNKYNLPNGPPNTGNYQRIFVNPLAIENLKDLQIYYMKTGGGVVKRKSRRRKDRN
jgi:hypothetical protein